MNYSQLSYGSKGSEVKKLQELLNKNGYSLDVDGVFGSKTQAAVKDYQTQNKLTVDGIAGNETWGALSGGSTSQAGAATTGTEEKKTAANMQFSYDNYEPSDTVQQAQALLQQQMASKPGAYQSQYQDQISALIDQFMNRDKFKYNLNEDALYQQYADQYDMQGKMAMMNTMGQAQAMTGGYGNSYAQAAGQQAYQGYLQQLNEVVPELYQMAYDRYQQEGQDMLSQYSLLASQDEQDYGRYRDQVGDYYTQLQQAYDQYNAERDYDYSKWADGRNFAYEQFGDDRAYAYQVERDQVADSQWQAEFDEAKRQYDQQYALAAGKISGGSDNPGDSDNDTGDQNDGGWDTHGLTTAQIKSLQAAAGITVDGIWGPDTEAAYQAVYGGNNQSGPSGNTGNEDQPNNSGSIPDSIKDKAASYTSNTDLANYLDGLERSGVITSDQADSLYAEHVNVAQTKSLKDLVSSTSGWKVVDNGGANWFWGVDNNAIVKAPNGQQYRLDNLVDALVSEGVSKSDAKALVKQLQNNLGV